MKLLCPAIGICLSLFFAQAGFAQVYLPISALHVTSPYGLRVHPITGLQDFHSGVDLAANHSVIYAVLAGRVISCASNPFLGNFIRIAHGEIQSIYGHLSTILIRQGTCVKAGEVIGISGSTGRSTAEHLHFSVRYQNQPIHPLKFLLQLQSSWAVAP